MTDEEPQYETHYVRLVPVPCGQWVAVCSVRECDFEFTGGRIDASLEADLHAHPTRGDGSGTQTTGRRPEKRRRYTP